MPINLEDSWAVLIIVDNKVKLMIDWGYGFQHCPSHLVPDLKDHNHLGPIGTAPKISIWSWGELHLCHSVLIVLHILITLLVKLFLSSRKHYCLPPLKYRTISRPHMETRQRGLKCLLPWSCILRILLLISKLCTLKT